MTQASSEFMEVVEVAAELQHATEKTVRNQKSAFAPAAATEPEATHKSELKSKLRSVARRLWANDAGPPIVSIVIPVFNKVSYTHACLESLSRQASQHSFEVVVVDNASSDETPHVIGNIAGIRYIRNKQNLGFVEGCNVGVKASRGEVIVLLNNDTVVQGNWLDAMVDRLLGDPEIGMVGSKLIYPDGSLQEAGGIIFSDGSGHNFGKHQKADDFEYNYCREVDYCSGASVAFYRKDFEKIGGFDMRFAPAYYEDTDLAMSMRHKLNKKVVYEPHSVVVHVEGVTAGTDTNSGFKKYQTINHDKFVKKWRSELKKYHYDPGTPVQIASRYGKRKHLLVVDSIVPEYNKDSGSLRMTQILDTAVKLGYDVTLFPDNRVATLPYTPQLQSRGIEVVYGSGLTLKDFYERRSGMYDDIILSRPTVAIWHVEYCKAFQPKAKLLYDTVDLHFLRIGRQAELEKKKTLAEEAKKWQLLEYYLMDHTDVTLLVSYEEQLLLEKQRPKVKTHIVSNINPLAVDHESMPYDKREGLLFMGDYSRVPNQAAAEWLVRDILPLVKKQLPDIKLTLLGSNPESIQRLASSDVVVTGFVEDTTPYYDQARVFVCPLRYGAGVKGKVSESIASGLPVVSTAIGVEGMHLVDGKSCLQAESPAEFAKQIVRLYQDAKIWQNVSTVASSIYQDYFSPEAGRKALKEVL